MSQPQLPSSSLRGCCPPWPYPPPRRRRGPRTVAVRSPRIAKPSLTGSKVRVTPKRYAAVKVDLSQLRGELRTAPGARTARTGLTLRVPTPTGGSERFAVHRTQVMQSKLAAAHPEITTYAGRSLDHPGTTIALDVTPMGFHASVRGPDGQRAWYVDPAYNRRGHHRPPQLLRRRACRSARELRVEREVPEVKRGHREPATAAAPTRPRPAARSSSGVYRLALITDPSYAAYFGTENVLAEKVTLINRVNQIYNDDLADPAAAGQRHRQAQPRHRRQGDRRRTVRAARTPASTARRRPADYGQGQLDFCDVGTLRPQPTVLGQLVGASNYDIGHIAPRRQRRRHRRPRRRRRRLEKAQGCTGLPEPNGDFYAIDYVAHEMGHQFGGNHTFNGTQWNCSGGNRNRRTSVEPGSGSSVMAYAGICRQDNLQPHSDPYFSQRSHRRDHGYTSGDLPPTRRGAGRLAARASTPTATRSPSTTRARRPTVTLTRGSTYDAAASRRPSRALTGQDVTVAEWGYDPYAGSTPTGLPRAAGRARRRRLPGDVRRRPRPVHRRTATSRTCTP